jgi:hypothetical protein
MADAVTKHHKKLKGTIPPVVLPPGEHFVILTKADVDGEPWYTVRISPKVRDWLVKQPTNQWYEHFGNNHYRVACTFDLSEKLYTTMLLTWL